MRIYLDNCCYNRPYDDQTQISISLESQAKLHIQDLIQKKEFELVTSYVLRYECSQNPFEMRREAIFEFIEKHTDVYVGIERQKEIEAEAEKIEATGVKFKDACHVASAVFAGCGYFISTDKRLLKYATEKLKMVTPIEFLAEMEGL